jgi:acid phosphatase
LKKILVSFLLFVPLFVHAQVPESHHVVIVLEENHSYSSVIGSSSMPYLNSLAAKYGLATQYYANTHPSIGNYFMLTAGELVTNNDALNSTVNVDNVVRHLLAAGKTWKSYAESLPYVGYTGGNAYPYVRHHNPLSYFSDVVDSSVQRLNLVPFSHFASDLANNALPNYSFVVPNINHDAHDCPTGPTGCTDAQKLATADAWLKNHIAPLLSNAEFRQDGILIIVFDESFPTDTAHGGGHVAAVVIGPTVKTGVKATTFYQHQNVLRTMLDALGVHTYPGSAAGAVDIKGLFAGISTAFNILNFSCWT